MNDRLFDEERKKKDCASVLFLARGEATQISH